MDLLGRWGRIIIGCILLWVMAMAIIIWTPHTMKYTIHNPSVLTDPYVVSDVAPIFLGIAGSYLIYSGIKFHQ